jgi:hypothetical protein
MRTCELQVEDLVTEDLRAAAQKVYCTHDGDFPVAPEVDSFKFWSFFKAHFKVTIVNFNSQADGRWVVEC